jgi:type I restriction enzyme S subunit
LEGLEISEVSFTDVLKASIDFRLHSEFFSKEFLAAKNYLGSASTLQLSKIAKIADGDHSKFPDNQTKDVRYLQARDITDNFLEIASDAFVSREYFAKNKRSLISGETILLSIMGTVGDITITPKDFEPCMCNRALAIVRDIKGISPQFLFAYLTTKHAFNSIERQKNGGVQQRINLDVLANIEVPVLGASFQSQVEKVVLLAQDSRKASKSIYTQAESQLLDTLGMADFLPDTETVNIKSFKGSFAATGRLDAEYYQPKYENFEALVMKHEKGFTTINAEYELVKATSPRDKAAYNYIEIGDVNVGDGAASFNRVEIADLPDNAKQEVIRGDLLISKVRPNRGAVAIIEFDDTDLIVSGAFTVLREKADSEFSNETLKVLLRTKIYRDWLLKFNIGTQYPVIRDEDILGLPIPKVEKEIQTKIAALVKESFTLKAESERLLAVAKRAVEMAIEQDEAAALRYLEQQTAALH